ncbi:MAG: DNA processing protein [Halieaceae bacterium]|jgi:DNA processing protein
MYSENSRAWLALTKLPRLGPGAALHLLERFKTPIELLSSSVTDWGLAAVPEDLARAVSGWQAGSSRDPIVDFVGKQLHQLCAADDNLVCWSDPEYPEPLRQIPDPPLVIFVKGDVNVLKESQLAVVGSRKATAAGLRTAKALAGDAANAGLIVTSGLAYGIDAAAHRGALAVGGASIAVIANGLDVCYPRAHASLASELVGRGALISEYPYGSRPHRGAFPRRNRIISGLSQGVLVVEAGLPSGSLITAQLAAEQGRDVFAVPGSIYQPGSRGCHQLLRDGAILVESFADIAEELGYLHLAMSEADTESVARVPNTRKARVLGALGYEPCSLDELVEVLAIPTGELLATLSELELDGLIERQSGGYQRA